MTSPTAAQSAMPTTVAELARVVSAGGRLLVRGLGRSYGDAAQTAGGTLLDLRCLDSVTWGADGLVTVGAGVSLHELINLALPRGWFVPVSPGTSWVTVGGAIAADVHGKNHHRDGSFGAHLTRIGVIDGLGNYYDVRPPEPRFWATVGGMGLTGAIVDATIQMIPVASPMMSVSTRRTRDFDDTLSQLHDADSARYSVAWLDCLAVGAHCGRGVVTFGDHAGSDARASRASGNQPLAKPKVVVPTWAPSAALNRRTVALFNSVWHKRAPVQRDGEIQSIAQFFHPLDAVGQWNRAYGSRGFVQYQFVVPLDAVDVLRSVYLRLVDAQVPSFLTVLKRFGAGNDSPLSFPIPGWTLAIDMPSDVPGLSALLDSLDDSVAGAGGRVYLAKDSRMSPTLMSSMYPRLSEWKAVRHQMDPHGVFTSDLGRRLHLAPVVRG